MPVPYYILFKCYPFTRTISVILLAPMNIGKSSEVSMTGKLFTQNYAPLFLYQFTKSYYHNM